LEFLLNYWSYWNLGFNGNREFLWWEGNGKKGGFKVKFFQGLERPFGVGKGQGVLGKLGITLKIFFNTIYYLRLGLQD